MMIDDLLSQPLADVPDNGFSARVVARIRAEEWWHLFGMLALGLMSIVAVALVLPLPVMSLELGRVVFDIGKQVGVSLALGVIVLSFLLERAFARG
jgi:hypothetical protein